MSKIVLGATVEGISTRQDNSFKIVIGTQEIEKNQVSDLFDMRNKYVKILISSTNIQPLQEKMLDEAVVPDMKKAKSPSKRLRATLFVLHQQNGGDESTFDTYYDEQMEKIISHFKEKLD